MGNEISNLIWTFGVESSVPEHLEALLVDGEQVIDAFRTIRDVAVFTNKRMLVSDTQGITGKKKEIYSLPYKNINMFSIENAGPLDINSEIELWTRAGSIKINLKRGADLNKIAKIIAQYIL